MNRDDIIDLLSIVAVTDHRTVGATDIDLWQKLIGQLPVNDCTEAILAHFREQPGVWLQPGHLIARVRATRADQLARMDPDERAASLAAQQNTRRDRHGYIDKSAAELEEWPLDWTPQQRVTAYWNHMQEYRDLQEYEQAIAHPRMLSPTRPATDGERAHAMQAMAAHQYSLQDLGTELPYVNPSAVRCDFCKSPPGEPCTMAGRTGEAREKCARAHPVRVELAAREAGFDEQQVRAVVTAWCRGAVTVARDSEPARRQPVGT